MTTFFPLRYNGRTNKRIGSDISDTHSDYVEQYKRLERDTEQRLSDLIAYGSNGVNEPLAVTMSSDIEHHILKTIESDIDELNDLNNRITVDMKSIQSDVKRETDKSDIDDIFEEKLKTYTNLSEHDVLAKKQYEQQRDNHIVFVSTNLALFAGSIGVMYLGLRKGGIL